MSWSLFKTKCGACGRLTRSTVPSAGAASGALIKVCKACSDRLKAKEAERQDNEAVLQRLVQGLLSSDSSTREEALVAARLTANAGKRRGVAALELAIRLKAGDPSMDLSEPGLALLVYEPTMAHKMIADIAGRHAICKEARQVTGLMKGLRLHDGAAARSVLSKIREIGGDDQVHEFQLVGTHWQAVDGYGNFDPDLPPRGNPWAA